MINLRYHIVSIVAVFLALGIGVALGSTFVDGFIVSTLETRVNDLERAESSLEDELAAQREALAAEQADRAAQEVAAIPLIGGGRLDEVPVMIIATEGVDVGAFQTIRAAVLGSSAQYEGTLWLTERLNLTDEGNRADVAEAFGLINDSENLVRRALETRLVRALFPPAPDAAGQVLGTTATQLANELLGSATDDLTVAPPAGPGGLASVLTQLRDAAIVIYDNEFATTGALDDVPAHGTRFIFISNADGELPANEIVLPLFDAVVAESLDVVLVALEPMPSEGDATGVEFVSQIRNDPDYATIVATVDHAATFNGTLAALIVTDTGDVLHLGTGEGATGELPAA